MVLILILLTPCDSIFGSDNAFDPNWKMAVFKKTVLLNISDEEESRTERVNRDIKAASTPAVRDVCVWTHSQAWESTAAGSSDRPLKHTKHTKLSPTMHSGGTGLMICLHVGLFSNIFKLSWTEDIKDLYSCKEFQVFDALYYYQKHCITFLFLFWTLYYYQKPY